MDDPCDVDPPAVLPTVATVGDQTRIEPPPSLTSFSVSSSRNSISPSRSKAGEKKDFLHLWPCKCIMNRPKGLTKPGSRPQVGCNSPPSSPALLQPIWLLLRHARGKRRKVRKGNITRLLLLPPPLLKVKVKVILRKKMKTMVGNAPQQSHRGQQIDTEIVSCCSY